MNAQAVITNSTLKVDLKRLLAARLIPTRRGVKRVQNCVSAIKSILKHQSFCFDNKIR